MQLDTGRSCNSLNQTYELFATTLNSLYENIVNLHDLSDLLIECSLSTIDEIPSYPENRHEAYFRPLRSHDKVSHTLDYCAIR